uniref:Leucine-rich repeat-containing N-terminal plant-type domain-containing protein n=1 Tax=Manihot esculenta TaxID=3983 RepID=A0A2C9V0J0_MANES
MELANIAKRLLLGVVILWIQIHGNKGCFEEERLALLDFKAFVGSNGFDADYLLPSWTDDPISNCCEWERVMCNSTTDHQLKEFKTLYLSYNNFDCYINDQGFDRLEKLDISWNRFNKSILSSLGALTSLNTLILSDMLDSMDDISGNSFNGILSFKAKF